MRCSARPGQRGHRIPHRGGDPGPRLAWFTLRYPSRGSSTRGHRPRGRSRFQDILRAYGGGLEIHLDVDLPMGSGLGTSSILAAAVLRALGEMLGPIAEPIMNWSIKSLLLEQTMTSGGGWQDQAGGIFPGAKLVLSGPGLRQRLRVQPLSWSAQRQTEFAQRFVFYYTGIQRVAKDLLAQVVGSYLAREVATVQVLHSIKTLAVEMATPAGR